MKLEKLLITTSIISVFIIGCNHKENVQKNKKVEKKITVKIENPKTLDSFSKKTNYELLQGKWQNEQDKTNFLVFDKNHRKEIAEGMENWDDDEFVLSDHCENESNQNDNSKKEDNKYISCKDSDLCWYIMSLDDNTLTIQYLDRGNTLIYKKIND